MSKTELFMTILCSLIASSGFWAFLSNIIQKPHIDAILEEIARVDASVRELKADNEENKADMSRVRILRFDDELNNGIKHSQEYFNQILADIDSYEKYCSDHPNYKNARTIEATKHIIETYRICRDEHLFV